MVDFEGTTGIWLDGKWNAISDLEKKEKKCDIYSGETTIEESHSRCIFSGGTSARTIIV